MAPTKVFLSGSTKGNHEHVKNRFKDVKDKISNNGIIKVITPTTLSEPLATWNDSIRSDISHLMSCGELHLLSNWAGHKRSEILRDIAMKIGIKVVYHH